MSNQPLFTPYRMGDLDLQNRSVVAPPQDFDRSLDYRDALLDADLAITGCVFVVLSGTACSRSLIKPLYRLGPKHVSGDQVQILVWSVLAGFPAHPDP